MPRTQKIVELYPNQLIKKNNKFRILFISMITLTILSFIMIISFIATLTTVTDDKGNKYYLPPNNIYLYLGIAFSIIGLVLGGFSFYIYYRIFGLEKSGTFYTLIGCLVLGFIFFIMELIFITKKYNFCPDGQTFDPNKKKCVPICEKGSILDDNTNTCIPFCNSKDDCNGTDCVGNSCCPQDKPINCGDICCKTENCQNNFCCASQNVCTGVDGKKSCCSSDESCQDGVCKIECPQDSGNYCDVGTTCSRFDYSDRDKYPDITNWHCDEENKYCYTCQKFNKTCSPTGTPYFYPHNLEGTTFYPASLYPDDPDQNFRKQILDNDHSQKAVQDLEATAQTGLPDHEGLYCGKRSDAYRLISIPFSGKDCEPSLQFDETIDTDRIKTDYTSFVKGADNKSWWVNMKISYKDQSQQPKNMTPLTSAEDGKGYSTRDKQDQSYVWNFHPFKNTASPTSQTLLKNDVQHPYDFDLDCDKFPPGCWEDSAKKFYDFTIEGSDENRIGYINKKQPLSYRKGTVTCVDGDGNIKCLDRRCLQCTDDTCESCTGDFSYKGDKSNCNCGLDESAPEICTGLDPPTKFGDYELCDFNQ